MIIRVEKTKNFTVIGNYHLRDMSISLKAKGLLTVILSLPDNWRFSVSGLAKICKEGVSSVRSALAELEEAGYLTRGRVRDEIGHLKEAEYIFREKSVLSESDDIAPDIEKIVKSNVVKAVESPVKVTEEPCTQTVDNSAEDELFCTPPILDSPMLENPILDSQTQLNTNISNTKKLNTYDTIKSYHSAEPAIQSTIGINDVTAYKTLIKRNIDYNILLENYSADEVDEIVDILTETVCSSRKYIRVAGDDKNASVVKSQFLKLDYNHICYVLDCVAQNITKVHAIKPYLLTSLWNAPLTMSLYYKTRVNYDMYGADSFSKSRCCA